MTQAVVCRCDQCRRTVAEIRDGRIVIAVRHDGEWHETTITLADLTVTATSGSSKT